MIYQKILLARKSGHIYEQFCLVTFFVSGYYGKSTVEDVELGRFTVVIAEKQLRYYEILKLGPES